MKKADKNPKSIGTIDWTIYPLPGSIYPTTRSRSASCVVGNWHSMHIGSLYYIINPMHSLEDKISKSQEIIREAYETFLPGKTVVAWTGGKDSTVVLHLIRQTFNDTVPFPVMFNDSTMEFGEIYDFIESLTKAWGLSLSVVPHDKKELETFYASPEKQKELSRRMKITAINTFIKQNSVKAFFAGIRWDEHEARSKEIYFSKRDTHTRIHPILHFTEADIWQYIKTFHVPYVHLYDQGYRSLGEKPFTKKATPGEGERSGREQAKEDLMKKLRSIGYW